MSGEEPSLLDGLCPMKNITAEYCSCDVMCTCGVEENKAQVTTVQ